MQQPDKLSKADQGNTQDVIQAPVISLPKGGGAMHGIGEKFAANPVTGTGSMTIPIATSPGRSGFGPQLSLSYDSGSGNGPFGLGWTLSLPAISRNTAKGLPRYHDMGASDTFILSGAEDLVEVLVEQQGKWAPEAVPPGELAGQAHTIQRYRPRIEGLFARIERWTNTVTRHTHWCAISKDNITTLYGATAESRIADPLDSTRIFSWLVCESYDDKGNAIVYEYAKENSHGIDPSLIHETHRTATTRGANRYPKRIKYGNRVSRLRPEFSGTEWLFEVVFDYGENHYQETGPSQISASASAQGGTWTARPDPFSTCRAGFDVRTYRRCQRVMMFHRFTELGSGPTLVRSTAFHYDDFAYSPAATVQTEMAHQGSTGIASVIASVTQSGYVRNEPQVATIRDGASYLSYVRQSLPPVQCEYSRATIQDDMREVDGLSIDNLPQGIDTTAYRWADLDGEGLSGILTQQGGAWFYKRNLSALPVSDTHGKPQRRARF
ncbi:MAG: SpvB/TcaC N-terminal domain-containing protein, partial [Telluria sp.]